MRIFSAIIVLFVPLLVSAQSYRGIVRDSENNSAVENCLVIVKGTTVHAITDKFGRFTLPLTDSSMISLVYTAPGYRIRERKGLNVVPDTIFLRSKSISIEEVTISGQRETMINEGHHEPVIDFELLHDHVLLLTANGRDNLLQLFDQTGNVLTTLKVRGTTRQLNYDCLGNLQLTDSDSSWQVYYDFIRLRTLNAYPISTFNKVLGECVCTRGNNYYFRHVNYQGLRHEYYFYNELRKSEKMTLCRLQDTSRVRAFELDYDLQYFLGLFRKRTPRPSTQEIIENLDLLRDLMILETGYAMLLGKLESQLVVAGRNLYLVNYNDSLLCRISNDNKLTYWIRFKALRENDLEKNICVDRQTSDAYLFRFSDNLLSAIQVDLKTGDKMNSYELATLTFLPRKIVVDNGRVFYLHRNSTDRIQQSQLRRFVLR